MGELAGDLLNGAQEASRYSGLPLRTIYHFVETRQLPVKRVGKRLFFRKSELDRFFSSNGQI